MIEYPTLDTFISQKSTLEIIIYINKISRAWKPVQTRPMVKKNDMRMLYRLEMW